MSPVASPTPLPIEPGATTRAGTLDVRPMWSLWLLSIAHAVNHAQAVVLPLIYLKITDDFNIGVDTIAFLAAGGAFAAGVVQLSFASLTRPEQLPPGDEPGERGEAQLDDPGGSCSGRV